VADRSAPDTHDAVCPHCKKPFEGELLTTPSASGSAGFKCPHCRLFVQFERANGPEPGGHAR
jgi:DNA-directed RNA polymerase subunit RPC12/RpoP